jgi:hypothetical protein
LAGLLRFRKGAVQKEPGGVCRGLQAHRARRQGRCVRYDGRSW